MRAIAGPGHVSNEFVDYDPVTNPNGTVVTADWGNDVQEELIGIQDAAGIAQAAGTNKYVKAAIIRISKEAAFEVGEARMIDGDAKAPVAFDKDAPYTYFPAVCITNFDGASTTISATNYPDFDGQDGLVTKLRARRLRYLDGQTGAAVLFNVTGWAVSSNVATLTFANAAPELAMLADLVEDEAVHEDEYGGSGFSDWGQTITLASAIGNIPAGTYALDTDVDAATRTVRFAVVATTGSGAVTATVEFYRHRIAGSTTTARLFSARGRALVGAGVGELVSGLRRRSYMQGHWHQTYTSNSGGDKNALLSYGTSDGMINVPTNPVQSRQPVTDGTNGTPRTGANTEPRALAAHIYLHGGRYVTA